MDEEIVIICDYEDGTIAFMGSREDAKEWWWEQISEQMIEVGGYALMTQDEYDEEFPLGSKPIDIDPTDTW